MFTKPLVPRMAGNVRRLARRYRPARSALATDNRKPGAVVAAFDALHFRRVMGTVGARPKVGGRVHAAILPPRFEFRTGANQDERGRATGRARGRELAELALGVTRALPGA